MRFSPILVIVLFLVSAGIAQAQSDDPVKDKLTKARSAYDAKIKPIRDEVTKRLSDRESAAVKTGNKKLVDQAEAELAMFEKLGVLPKSVDSGPLRRRAEDARNAMIATLSSAITEYTKSRMKPEAQAAEQELLDFKSGPVIGFPFGRGRYLSTMEPSEVSTQPNAFRTDGTVQGMKVIIRGLEFPTSIHPHPLSNNASRVGYKLDKKWNTFRAGVVIPYLRPDQKLPATALTFEVLGDGKSLWKSKPIARVDEPQWVEVTIKDVESLTLLVHCPGPFDYAWAVWLNPRLSLDNLPGRTNP